MRTLGEYKDLPGDIRSGNGYSLPHERPARTDRGWDGHRALVYDLVGSKQALNGMALVSLADKLFAVLGALSAGVLLAQVGASGAFGGMGAAYFFSALCLAGVKRAYRWKRKAEEASSPEDRPSGKFTKNLVMIWKNPGLLFRKSLRNNPKKRSRKTNRSLWSTGCPIADIFCSVRGQNISDIIQNFVCFPLKIKVGTLIAL